MAARRARAAAARPDSGASARGGTTRSSPSSPVMINAGAAIVARVGEFVASIQRMRRAMRVGDIKARATRSPLPRAEAQPLPQRRKRALQLWRHPPRRGQAETTGSAVAAPASRSARAGRAASRVAGPRPAPGRVRAPDAARRTPQQSGPPYETPITTASLQTRAVERLVDLSEVVVDAPRRIAARSRWSARRTART